MIVGLILKLLQQSINANKYLTWVTVLINQPREKLVKYNFHLVVVVVGGGGGLQKGSKKNSPLMHIPPSFIGTCNTLWCNNQQINYI